MRGAEAVIKKTTIIGRAAVVKTRMAKTYRNPELDKRLRTERTRSEARLLNKAKIAGVSCPTVFEVDSFEITMSFIEGGRPLMNSEQCFECGRILSALHEADIIHGDFTPANLIDAQRITVIDFGLGFVSKDIEDKAVDVFTMLKSINEKESFINGYRSYKESGKVLLRVKDVEKRVRYATG